PHADARLLFGHASTYRDDHAAGLVAGDDRASVGIEAQRCRPACRAVEFQIRPAHARGLDLEHDLARPGGGIGKIFDFDPAVGGGQPPPLPRAPPPVTENKAWAKGGRRPGMKPEALRSTARAAAGTTADSRCLPPTPKFADSP